MPVEKLQDAFANTPFLKGTPNDQILSLYSVGGPNSPGIAAASIDNDLIAKQPLSVGPQVPFISGFSTCSYKSTIKMSCTNNSHTQLPMTPTSW